MTTDARLLFGSYDPIRADNVLANTSATRAASIRANAPGLSNAARMFGEAMYKRSPEGQQAQQNAMAQNEAATQGAQMDVLAKEHAIVGRMLQSLSNMPDAQRAQAYDVAIPQLEAAGIDIPDGFETYSPEGFQTLQTVYSHPPGTDLSKRYRVVGTSLVDLQAAGGPSPVFTAETAQDAPKPTNLMREYEMARQQGYQGDLLQYQKDRRGGGMSVTMPDGTQINMGGPGGAVEAGERDKTRGREMGKLDAKRQEMGRKAMNGLGALERRDKVLLDAIDSALQQIESGVLNTGLPGQLFRGIGGTSALELDKTMDTIKANLGFNELNDMRQNSPTGGALGQVTERELAFLQSTQGSLDTAQRDGKLQGVLQDIRDNLIASAADRRAAYERDFGIGEQQAPEAQQFDAERTINGTRYIQRGGEWFVAP